MLVLGSFDFLTLLHTPISRDIKATSLYLQGMSILSAAFTLLEQFIVIVMYSVSVLLEFLNTASTLQSTPLDTTTLPVHLVDVKLEMIAHLLLYSLCWSVTVELQSAPIWPMELIKWSAEIRSWF